MPSDAVLARAAELRAAGSSWEAVADQVSVTPRTARGWPGKYADRWRAALAAAERRVLADAAAESVLILRLLLRSKDEKVRGAAARALVALRPRRPADADPADTTSPRTADARRLVAFLEGLSDDDLARLAAAEFAPPAGGAGVAEAGPPAG